MISAAPPTPAKPRALPRHLSMALHPAAPRPVDRARRMRFFATGLLVAMAALFFVARWFREVDPAWGQGRVG